ncbi:MAG: 3-oxoacyl-[acyl-carrier-protein] reductase [Myxococcales bacterium]|nr:3-oxoacyl-[acyl-carrier-protein] reductase [Myxococcales bacterium]
MTDLKGKKALVTGASRGIGRAIALRLAEAGADVAITYRENKALAADVVAEIERGGAQARAYAIDLADVEALEDRVAAIIAEAGGPDIVVNNAGITLDSLLMRTKGAALRRLMDTNLRAVIEVTRIASKPMLKARWGRIVNIASVSGQVGNAGQAAYAATKAGLIGFTRAYAREVASRGITVNAVSPGYIDTDMTSGFTQEQRALVLQQIPMGRVGKAEEVAEAVAFVASDRAGYITGQVINVNGGMYMG